MSMAEMYEENDEEFELEIHWDLTPQTLVAMMYLNEWAWDIEGSLRVPTAAEIEDKVTALIEACRDFGGGAYFTLNGLKVYKDPEFPESYEIYIKAGHVSPRIPEGSK